MNWYKKAINTEKLEWGKILSSHENHVKAILEGKKPAGFFDIKFNDNINYMNYPEIFDTIKLIKQNRPDLKIYQIHYKNPFGTIIDGYAIGQSNAVQSILKGIKKIVYEGFNNEEAHQLFGEGVGYTQPEINEFLEKSDIDDSQDDLSNPIYEIKEI